MDDLISRQEAIKALGERPLTWVGGDYELGVQNRYDIDLLAIETVPPANLEQKKGRWSGDFCSCCGISKYNYILMRKEDGAVPFGVWNYCPNCGAEMDGGQNDN